MRKEFYCIQSTNIIAKVQLYTDDIVGNGGFYAFTCIGEDKSGTGYSQKERGWLSWSSDDHADDTDVWCSGDEEGEEAGDFPVCQLFLYSEWWTKSGV